MRLGRALIVVAMSGVVTAAHAQAPSPEELVADGERLARDGRIAESLPLFREAARRAPTGKRECLVALTYFRLGRHPEAWLHLERAKALGERPRWCGDAVLVRDVARALKEGAFAPVEISVQPPDSKVTISSLAAEESLVAPARVWLAWGTQRLRVERDGFVPSESEVVVEGKDPIPVRVVLDRVGKIETAKPLVAGRAATSEDSQPTRARRRWPWGLVAVGVASLGGGAAFHVAALRSREDATESYRGPAFDAALDRFRLRRTAALGLYAAGATLTVVGAWLLSRSRGDHERAELGVALVPAPGGAAVWVRIGR